MDSNTYKENVLVHSKEDNEVPDNLSNVQVQESRLEGNFFQEGYVRRVDKKVVLNVRCVKDVLHV